MKHGTTDFLVGLFVLLGFASLAYLSISLARLDVSGGDGYIVQANFTNCGHLRDGAPVVIAGVEIGRVKKIDLDREEYEAVVRMLIDNDINLQEDVMASIKTKGLIGEKFIEITLGGADELIKKDGSGRIWETEPVMDIERIISLVMSNMGGGDDE